MKKYIYLFVFGIVFWSCENTGLNSIANELPTTPKQVFPSDNLLCTDNAVAFAWDAASDPEGYNLRYHLQVATISNFSEILHDVKNITSTTHTISLERGIAYYWRVSAIDAELDQGKFSETYQFYTEGEGVSNYAPFSPILVAPSMNGSLDGTSAILEWVGKDVDEDTLVYDVYFGTENPPSNKISEDQEESTLSVDLNTATDYYWRVVIDDQNGGQIWGQIWNFSTN